MFLVRNLINKVNYANTTGIHIKILAPKGLIRAVQGEGHKLV